ncbi:nuclear transport factor 2 family protein [Roseateles amylovorans]|uniref:Nuclear transport factor 2 family protein n=1 Tax=Roseateles amylovorans TaxID=2978473 RepID=A0ABY6AWG8_9BURK|nr:nuclear transport factor 2 family protein [Roseateles amylovorans]UXH76161.1 nuclear transport factor 2 family protein [Roseateles amylovorans]
MTAPTLPRMIAAYFAADRQGPEAVARCFTEHATVKDEKRTFVGRGAIQSWKAAAQARFTYTTTPTGLAHDDGMIVVTGRVEGNFPGSPVDLRYRFQLEGDLIASLEITA